MYQAILTTTRLSNKSGAAAVAAGALLARQRSQSSLSFPWLRAHTRGAENNRTDRKIESHASHASLNGAKRAWFSRTCRTWCITNRTRLTDKTRIYEPIPTDGNVNPPAGLKDSPDGLHCASGWRATSPKTKARRQWTADETLPHPSAPHPLHFRPDSVPERLPPRPELRRFLAKEAARRRRDPRPAH